MSVLVLPRPSHATLMRQAVSVSQLLDNFALYQASYGLSPRTIHSRACIIGSLPVDPAAATLHDLRVFVARPCLSAASRRTYCSTLRAFYAWLVEDGYRTDNPAEKLHAAHVPTGAPRPFTPEQVDALLHSGAYKRTRVMILLGAYAGFRVSQIARTRGEDIDLISDTIRTIGKGRKELRLPLHPVIRDAAHSMPRTGWWFPARRGQTGHITGQGVSGLIRRAKLRAGISDPKLTAHSLRHAFASAMVEADVDIRVVQTLMGHSSLATTQVYAGVSERRRKAGIHALPVVTLPLHAVRRAA